ncbi:mas-related G-protein coupled receptor member D-like [Tiliqua scincoides]|uniref:mas-related G-protein coupled receptor member D-like n=1 Tax=Tiliqua scincoides TaxID=71010 RepID=UPI003461F2CB
MTTFSVVPSSPVSAELENYTLENGTLDFDNSSWCYATDVELAVISTFICVPCVFGLLGNGAVIWILGFCMKRTPVTTYILNLAVADFAVLLFIIPIVLLPLFESYCLTLPFFLVLVMAVPLFHLMFSVSQFLLTIISVDRCVSVLFPIWYRCHRPEKLSTILCALVWIFCFLVHGICYTFVFLEENVKLLYLIFVNALVCLPVVTICSLVLVIKFCFKTQQRQRKKLLMAILLALFFFLFLAFPLNAIHLQVLSSDYFSFVQIYSFSAGYLCASLNSFINLLIYFLVGRKKRCLGGENWKLIFQRVFKQEENVHGQELQLSVQIQVSV